jgi:hypothetical protein
MVVRRQRSVLGVKLACGEAVVEHAEHPVEQVALGGGVTVASVASSSDRSLPVE